MRTPTLITLALSLTSASCAMSGLGESAAEVGPCQVANASGRGDDTILAGVNDPVAALLRSANPCPTSLEGDATTPGLLKSLGLDPSCLDTHVIAPDTYLMVAPPPTPEKEHRIAPWNRYRTVTTLRSSCNGVNHEPFDLIFFQAEATRKADAATPGLGGETDQSKMDADGRPLGGAEIMARDTSTGVYNYYSLENIDPTLNSSEGLGLVADPSMDDTRSWTYHGDSIDLITTGSTSRCARCHKGGGIIMRELQSPWMSWHAPGFTGAMPGVDEFMAQHPALGSLSTGNHMQESIADPGNHAWNGHRIDHNANPTDGGRGAGSLRALLRPLFCDVEINLDSASGTAKADSSFSVRGDMIVDRALAQGSGVGFSSISVNGKAYLDALASRKQFILETSKAMPWVVNATPSWPINLRDLAAALIDNDIGFLADIFFNNRLHDDAMFALTFLERSGADLDYVQQLLSRGFVDQALVEDVLGVDFTRPIHSDDRCGLVDRLPDTADSLSGIACVDATGAVTACAGAADKTRAAVTAMVEGTPPVFRSSGQNALLANLTGTPDALHARVKGFVDACTARQTSDAAGFALDLVKLADLQREYAREHFDKLYQIPAQLPFQVEGHWFWENHLDETCHLAR